MQNPVSNNRLQSDIVIEELDIHQPGALKALHETVLRFWTEAPNERVLSQKEFNGTRKAILQRLEDKTPFSRGEKIALSFANGKLQGIAIYNTDEELDGIRSWKVNHLLSAPWNVLRTADRCKGACRSLINHIIRQATRAASPQIHLVPTLSSEPFYKALGLTEKDYHYVRTLSPSDPMQNPLSCVHKR